MCMRRCTRMHRACLPVHHPVEAHEAGGQAELAWSARRHQAAAKSWSVACVSMRACQVMPVLWFGRFIADCEIRLHL